MDTKEKIGEELVKKIEKLQKKVATLKNIESVYKQTEQELRIKEEAIASAINPIAFSDLDGNVIYANTAFLKTWGYDSGGVVLGKPVVGFWHKKEDALEMMKTLREKGSWIGEFIARRKDDSKFDARVAANLVKNREGNPVCMMVSFIDISDRRKAEKALRDNENKYRDLVENTVDIIYTLDTAGNITSVNEAIKTVQGFEPEEVIGKNFALWISKEELPKAMAAFKRVLNGEKIIAEIILLDKDGKGHNVEFSSTPVIMNNRVVGTRGIIRDITERRQIEKALRQSEQKYRLIAENTSDYVAVMTFSGIYSYASLSHRQLGYKPEDLIGKSGLDMIHPEDKLKLLPLLKQYAEKKIAGLTRKKIENISEHIEFRFPDKKGNWHDMEATANLAKSVSGKGYDILFISRDVTERKKAEVELKEQNDLVDRTNRELKRKVVELEAAMGRIKRLEGLVPMCVNCKKMRLEGGDPKDPKAWVSLEKYLSERTDASFTHGLCPDCIKKMYMENSKKKGSK